eukprot:CAMPEP_0194133986 /NCGR_PEP_ID=MMETSP0152-20130528/4039_1 /TAXON_ID=1049557 /ORGANISM="Thalassiothrix antarctica, Strain L6-D1" /LENGTH=286 /DNA_ID=CAMNT_0038829473 /DNA_START=9 /DNA_END=869 /DNA_ORIENTATION=-
MAKGILTVILLLASILLYSYAFVPSSNIHDSIQRGKPLMLRIPLLGRFRKKKSKEELVDIPPPIEIGASIPDVDVEILTKDEEGNITSVPASINEVLGNNTKSILIGMPGAFTPTCTKVHLPGYISASKSLKNLGIENIAIVTTNDRFVTEQWARNIGLIRESDGEDKIEILDTPVTLLADGDGDLVKSLGLADDMGFGLGIRSQRFALIIDEGSVTNVLTDDGMEECIETSAINIVNILTPPPPPEDIMNNNELLIDGKVIAGGVSLALIVAAFLTSGGENYQYY